MLLLRETPRAAEGAGPSKGELRLLAVPRSLMGAWSVQAASGAGDRQESAPAEHRGEGGAIGVRLLVHARETEPRRVNRVTRLSLSAGPPRASTFLSCDQENLLRATMCKSKQASCARGQPADAAHQATPVISQWVRVRLCLAFCLENVPFFTASAA